MKRILIAAALVAAVSAPAAAQSTMTTAAPRPMQFGIMAGATIPQGDAGDLAKTGFHLGGLVNFQPSMVPLALRGEVTYHGLSGKEFEFEGFPANGPDLSIISGTINGLFEFGSMGTVSTTHPYVIGGLGVYRSKFSSDGEDNDVSSTDFGFNAGVGVRFGLGGLNTFAEARFHNVFVGDNEDGEGGSIRFVPISFGIAF
jgi:opacity protein-like surface antigen